MKGLYLRDKTWWLRFTPAPGEAQVRISLDTEDEIEALKEARVIRQRMSENALREAGEAQAEIDAYIHHKKAAGLAKSTLTSRKYVLQKFMDMVGSSSPRMVSRASVQKWYDQQLALNPHTATAYLSIVNYWFKWLISDNRCTLNPAAQIKKPQIKMRRRKHFLLPAEARKLIETCEEEGLLFALYCGLHAGMRKLEVIEARPDWFDLQEGLIHIQATETFEPKDRDNRTVPMTDEFRIWLKNTYGLKKPFMLQPTVKHGKYRYRFDFRKAFDSLALRCGFPNLTFHDLRRTFASLLVSKGVSLYKVAKWLGDTTEVVEETYGHLIPQDTEINKSWK